MTFINRHHTQTSLTKALLYIDINNLYCWALSQKLPYANFMWVTEVEEIEPIIQLIRDDNLDGDSGYTLEVDIHIPNELHN